MIFVKSQNVLCIFVNIFRLWCDGGVNTSTIAHVLYSRLTAVSHFRFFVRNIFDLFFKYEFAKIFVGTSKFSINLKNQKKIHKNDIF